MSRGIGGEFVRFFVVGVGATLLHMGVYLLLNALFGVTEAHPVALTLTYAIGYVVSMAANYAASLMWTFKTSGSVGKGAGFIFSHAVNAGVHLGLLNAFRCLGVGSWLVALVQWLAPRAVELLPVLGQAESLLPIPIYVVAVPLNFFMVRFFLKEKSVVS